MSTKKILLLICAALLTLGIVACEKPGTAEKAGEAIDNAAKDAGGKIKDAADKVGEKIEEAGDKVGEVTDK